MMDTTKLQYVLYEAMFIAEDRMDKALRDAYGHDARGARYDRKRNAATPELAKAHTDFQDAAQAYLTAALAAS
jgi:hypothetical protein